MATKRAKSKRAPAKKGRAVRAKRPALEARSHSAKRALTKRAPPKKAAPVQRSIDDDLQRVDSIFQHYADRAVFRGFSRIPVAKGKGKATYRLTWHHNKLFEVVADIPKRSLRFPVLLPGVLPGSDMHREFRRYIKARHSPDLPPHRRVDPQKARLSCANRGSSVSLTLTSADGDFDYAARRLILAVHEIFLIFLVNGPYFDYLVEHFGVDPDSY